MGENSADVFEVLVDHAGDVKWIAAYNGQYPSCAYDIGSLARPEIRIGRLFVNNNQITVGKVRPSFGCMFYNFNGTELRAYNYDVLCI